MSRFALPVAAWPLTVVFVLAALSRCAEADVVLDSGLQQLRIDTRGGLIAAWRTCAAACTAKRGATTVLDVASKAGGEFRWRSNDAADLALLENLQYVATVEEGPDAITATLRSLTPVGGGTLIQRYTLSPARHELRMRLQAPPGVSIALKPAEAFSPESLPGFGAVFSVTQRVTLTARGQSTLDESALKAAFREAAPDAWYGFRSRFWAWLLQPDRTTRVGEGAAPGRLAFDVGDGLELRAYAGPVDWPSLREVDASLPNLLWAGLWPPLRWLAFGLYFLLEFLRRWIPSAGVAIIMLSLCVKILLFPLTWLADRWQADVNRIQNRIAPRLAAIRSEYSGEEAHRRTLATYQEEGVSPWFTLKSLGGFAIQVPIFIAAFDMLGGNFALSGESFLWIRDLARPDGIAALPVTVPFFGGELNLLPCLMTLLTVISATLQREAALSRELQARQRRQLYLMAGAFFLLFYTFPAGMVLYWAANNGWHLLKILFTQRDRRQPATPKG